MSSKKYTKFIVHVQFGEDMPETLVPIFATSLDEANEWADTTYTNHGIEVSCVHPHI